MRRADGKGANRDNECGERHRRSRSSPTHRGSATGRKKVFGDSADGPGGLGITTSCRARARNRARLRGASLAYRRHDLAALRRNPGDARCLSCACRDLVTLAQTEEGRPMTSEPMPMPVAGARTVSPPISTAPDCPTILTARCSADRPQHRQAHPHDAVAGERLCDDRPAPASQPSSATTVSGRPESPPISRTAARSKRPRRWRTTPRRAPRSLCSPARRAQPRMRSSGS
jgi:hypothetical protein